MCNIFFNFIIYLKRYIYIVTIRMNLFLIPYYCAITTYEKLSPIFFPKMPNVYSGIEFKKKYGNIFYKTLKKDFTENEITYKEGINIYNKEKIYPSKFYNQGIPFFSYYKDCYYDFHSDPFICSVNILDDSLVKVKYENNFRADKIEIQNISSLHDSILFKNKTEDEYNNIVEMNGLLLKYIPDECKTEKICKTAVEKQYFYHEYSDFGDYTILQHVPDKIKTYDICKIAVTKNGNALEFVPDKFKTNELKVIAFINNNSFTQFIDKDDYALQSVPDKFKTKELCEIAVKKNGNSLKYVPNELKTNKLCEIAVTSRGTALEFVPDKFKTKKICEIAVTNDDTTYRKDQVEKLMSAMVKIA